MGSPWEPTKAGTKGAQGIKPPFSRSLACGPTCPDQPHTLNLSTTLCDSDSCSGVEGMRYGVGYKGSKSRVAGDIIRLLPSGKRLIDLFGGGGAIAHCAAESGKWGEVIYSDCEPSIVSLCSALFSGEFRSNLALFDWVSRERFFAEKDNNAIIRWVWSFGNNGQSYLYGANIESQKEAIHRAIVDKTYSPIFLELTGGEIPFYHHGIGERKKDWSMFCRTVLHSVDSYRVPHLERLTNIQSVNLDLLRCRIECLFGSYTEYKFREGDIVYCDPPYSGTKCDSYSGFDNAAFWDWARTVPCYVSEYRAPKDFMPIWQKEIMIQSTSDGNGRKAIERLFKSPACK